MFVAENIYNWEREHKALRMFFSLTCSSLWVWLLPPKIIYAFIWIKNKYGVNHANYRNRLLVVSEEGLGLLVSWLFSGFSQVLYIRLYERFLVFYALSLVRVNIFLWNTIKRIMISIRHCILLDTYRSFLT